MRYFLVFSYFGKAYHGWQRQPNAITVQEVLEETLSTVLKKSIALVGAGRTDTGVHAKQMVAHFDCDEIAEKDRFIHKCNAFLPEDIALSEILQVTTDAHARFDALERTYAYWITTRKNPFYTDSAYYIKNTLSVEVLNKAASVLLEYTNFECFSKSNTDVKTYQCHITKAMWTQDEDKMVFTITADRFLRNMVRAIVGTLLEVASGKLTMADLNAVIESKNRANAGFSVPAKGLYLMKVTYPERIYITHG
ncbi:tRNA pseudouridine(38-40) synthase TruA [Arenibacter sp. GZD96]|uniref:tRNA pseudouridine(38-40) synthase TruA n=1 Tax=Aurantibrevibacter litoralis TaxID=3106030 RepID=UPI002AFFA682|nr:tRNA pseudouridine(38-40) synthase TruA [Arenibacter sp. GZD-96]MEA1784667.1 tRNA pseudouridine(38-40) synthase TruA [Arenibacter sp. GZD-96]